MNQGTEELRQALSKMQAQLEAARARRAARPAGGRALPAPIMPVEFAAPPAKASKFKRLAGPGLGLLAASAGLLMGNHAIAMAGLMLAIAFVAWGSGTGGPYPLGELARRISILERRAASSGGASSALDEEFQELRSILKALMSALDNPEEGKGGKV